MTKKGLKIIAVILLFLFALYWAAVNVLVSAVLVPSFMEKLDAFQRISEQSYAEQVQEDEMKQNLTAMTVVGKVWGRQPGIEQVERRTGGSEICRSAPMGHTTAWLHRQ